MEFNMSMILAIETSTEACSCALYSQGDVHEIFDVIPRQHASKLLFMIKSLLGEHALTFSDLDAIAYGQGPGSFTGLRIAAGVTQGIAFGAEIPVIPVSSLASLAFQVKDRVKGGYIFSTLDARIDEMYWGLYTCSKTGEILLSGKERLCKPELLPAQLLDELEPENLAVFAVGSGLHYQDRMPEHLQDKINVFDKSLYPRASAVAWIASKYFEESKVQSPEQVNPVYIRDKVTHS